MSIDVMPGSTALVPAGTERAPDALRRLLAGPEPVLSRALMEDVTDLPYWTLIDRYSGADFNFTEYFRVKQNSRLNKNLLQSITKNPTGRPAIAALRNPKGIDGAGIF